MHSTKSINSEAEVVIFKKGYKKLQLLLNDPPIYTAIALNSK
jgi:hypothetical protein